MPDKKPSLYDLKKTTFWFAISAVVLLVGLVVMVLQDSIRGWKHWQVEFMNYSREKAEGELQKAEKSVDEERLRELTKNLETAKNTMSSRQNEIDKISQDLSHLELEITKVKTRYQDLKQFQDSDRYFLEEYKAKGEKEKAASYEKKLSEKEAEVLAAKRELEKLEAERDEKETVLKQWAEETKGVEREIKKLTQDVTTLENKIQKLKPSIINDILNAPMLDFLNPTLRIQQIVVENLHDDYYFTKVQKVDRCITCHLGIDQKGFEDAPQPFTTHPRLDLFLSSNSPHPMEEFGCTACHGGSGHSVDFVTAAHTPHSKKQAEEWKKEYHWHPMKHWSEKMLPLNHVEASCAKCHTGVVDVPQAPKLNEGRNLAQTFGCFGCHKVEGFEDRWKVGPDLSHVQSKLESDWIVRWLENPKDFRPSTKMPRVFNLSNTSDPESVEKNNAMIAGIATYLMKNSDPVSLEPPPAEGDPEKGERLVKEVGCLGCHTVGSLAANNYGPELSNLGSKVKPEWLYTWLKNPKHYAAETRMPNLRLSDQEASDITSYLLSQRNEKFDSNRPPLVKPEAVDDLLLTFMTSKMRFQEAKAELDKMTPEARLEYVGRQAIAQQGCFGCHTIKGFESAKPIGTELTEEGSKELERLDFGFVDIERTRQAWFYQKLKEPRIFDRDKMKEYHEKLRMPQFDFTDEQAEALVTFLLSLQKVSLPLEMKKSLSIAEKQVEAGRLLTLKLNCQGCHTLDGKEGAVRTIIEDIGNAPPILDGEGKKVQEVWLYHFLENPTPIRPWLHYRMPTFGFHEEELTTFVQYFNHLSGIEPSYKGTEIPQSTPAEIEAGHKLFQSFQCIKCHKSNPEPGLSASFLAPDLVMSKTRLRPDWIIDWLKDPQALQPGTMMPAFFPDGQSPVADVFGGDALKQIKALRDYLMVFTPEEAAGITEPVKASNA
ncbi:MAG TPA: c-type cytochrome [bacterium]|nr:c-type cytochrome [bacterium]